MDLPIAKSEIIYCSPDGNELTTVVQVGQLRQQKDQRWACDVEIPNVERLRTIHGDDSLHTLILAMGFLADRLEYLVNSGASVLSPDTREPAPISQVLPRL
jgi:hypothetical protein